jgi:hypothetical protein
MRSNQDDGRWETRAARNQALFRAINDELKGSPAREEEVLTVACECADTDCVETLAIALVDYERVREEGTHFVVLPGHVYPEVEDVIAKHSGFIVVEKTGAAARVAAAAEGGA